MSCNFSESTKFSMASWTENPCLTPAEQAVARKAEKKMARKCCGEKNAIDHGKPMVTSPLIRPAIYWGGSFGGVP